MEFFRLRASPRPIKFIVAGLANTVFGYFMFAIFLWIFPAKHFSLIIATLLGIIFNFFVTGRFVFENKSLRKAGPFFAAYVLLYIINAGMLEIFSREGLHPLAAQAISLPCVVVIGYLINSRLVFGQHT